MDAREIVDENTLRIWLAALPRDQIRSTNIWIGLRAACRVFPVWAAAMSQSWARERGVTALPILRNLLTRGTDGKSFSPAIFSATFDAYFDTAAREARSAAPNDISEAAISGSNATGAAYDGARVAAAWMPSSEFYDQIVQDAEILSAGGDYFAAPLWHGAPPLGFSELNEKARALWAADPPTRWDFWTRWWDGVISGYQLDWELQRRVALIPNEVWNAGPDAVATEIRRIEEEWRSDITAQDQFARQLSSLGLGDPTTVKAVGTAMAANRRELPATLDAVLGYISLEIERLQNRNYRSAEDEEECKRQIGVLTTSHLAVTGLLVAVPEDESMTPVQAEKAEKLTRLYIRKFQEWPRANADELTDSVFRAALIGVSVVALPLMGVSSLAALTAGTILFGGKKVVEAVKAAKDLRVAAKP